MNQTCEKSSLAMTHKLDGMIELPKSQPKKTCKEDLECEIVMVKIPRCMSWLGSTDVYDEPICSLDIINNKVENPSPQSTPQILPSFVEHTPPVTYSKEVEETLGIPIEVEPLDQTKLEDLLELMLLKRSKENTKYVSAAGEELTAAKHKLILLV
uniref:Uncharacterized protein n=1 Tax=Tanacetum cinerariifolium TaxID=118510 RepID=A0A6L2LTN6_TANCI|nr:hypothetical protein [Tanacetum cinerariifolium]